MAELCGEGSGRQPDGQVGDGFKRGDLLLVGAQPRSQSRRACPLSSKMVASLIGISF
jgi:hypothetical protein